MTVNLKVKDRTNRVLGVVKEKYGLKDKGEALDKFAELYGEQFVESEVKDELVRKIIRSTDAHVEKHGFRTTSVAQLRRLAGD